MAGEDCGEREDGSRRRLRSDEKQRDAGYLIPNPPFFY
jgi:hypothetical protein